MKKILSLLSGWGLTAAAPTAVISCATESLVKNINATYKDGEIIFTAQIPLFEGQPMVKDDDNFILTDEGAEGSAIYGESKTNDFVSLGTEYVMFAQDAKTSTDNVDKRDLNNQIENNFWVATIKSSDVSESKYEKPTKDSGGLVYHLTDYVWAEVTFTVNLNSDVKNKNLLEKEKHTISLLRVSGPLEQDPVVSKYISLTVELQCNINYKVN